MWSPKLVTLLLQATFATGLAVNITTGQDTNIGHKTTSLEDTSSIPLVANLTAHPSISQYAYRALIDDGVFRVQQAYPNAQLVAIECPGSHRKRTIILADQFDTTMIHLLFYTPRVLIRLKTGSPDGDHGAIQWHWPPVTAPTSVVPTKITWPPEIDIWEALHITRFLSQGQPRTLSSISNSVQTFPAPLGVKEAFRFVSGNYAEEWWLLSDQRTVFHYPTSGRLDFLSRTNATGILLPLANDYTS